ncbi:hypothetical protein ACIQZI_03575 [Peribacillus sp. NPDC096379]|uniref:hypothetical protein n=1 Tax=Peribacillus sp. NPDC096379 TaxID=3364393 RepID=UPI003804EF9C
MPEWTCFERDLRFACRSQLRTGTSFQPPPFITTFIKNPKLHDVRRAIIMGDITHSFPFHPLRAANRICVPGSSLYVPVRKAFVPDWKHFERALRFACRSQLRTGTSFKPPPFITTFIKNPKLHDVRRAIIMGDITHSFPFHPSRAANRICVPGSSLYVPVQKAFMPEWTCFERALRFACRSQLRTDTSFKPLPFITTFIKDPKLHDVRRAIIMGDITHSFPFHPLRAANRICVPGSSLYVPVRKAFVPEWKHFERALRFACRSPIRSIHDENKIKDQHNRWSFILYLSF